MVKQEKSHTRHAVIWEPLWRQPQLPPPVPAVAPAAVELLAGWLICTHTSKYHHHHHERWASSSFILATWNCDPNLHSLWRTLIELCLSDFLFDFSWRRISKIRLNCLIYIIRWGRQTIPISPQRVVTVRSPIKIARSANWIGEEKPLTATRSGCRFGQNLCNLARS